VVANLFSQRKFKIVERNSKNMELKESKTYRNLKAAFAGESEARNKYTYYASKAKKEGYNQIGTVFMESAENEKEHAKIWFKLLNSGIASTKENLKDSIASESYENTVMYKQFAREAKEEGFDEISLLFERVGEIEKTHEERYKKLLENLECGTVFLKPKEEMWICSNCGYSILAKQAPETCPVCSHPQGYFVLGEI
jgi:rubrerythrin